MLVFGFWKTWSFPPFLSLGNVILNWRIRSYWDPLFHSDRLIYKVWAWHSSYTEPLNLWTVLVCQHIKEIYIYICESHHGSWTCLTFKENYVRRPCMLHVAMWCNPEIHLNFFMLRLCMLVKSRISFCTFPWRKELQVPLFYLTSITLTKV